METPSIFRFVMGGLYPLHRRIFSHGWSRLKGTKAGGEEDVLYQLKASFFRT